MTVYAKHPSQQPPRFLFVLDQIAELISAALDDLLMRR